MPPPRRSSTRVVLLFAGILVLALVNVLPWMLHTHTSGNRGRPYTGGKEMQKPYKLTEQIEAPVEVFTDGPERPQEDGRKYSFTLSELMDGQYQHFCHSDASGSLTKGVLTCNGTYYKAARGGRVCDSLPSNVSFSALRANTKDKVGLIKEYLRDLSPEERGVEDEQSWHLHNGSESVENWKIRKQQERLWRTQFYPAAVDAPSVPKELMGAVTTYRFPKYAYVLMISNHKYVDGALVVADSLRAYSQKVQQGDADLIVIINDKIKMSSVRMLQKLFDRVQIFHTMAVHVPKSYYQTTFDKMYLFWMTEYEAVMLLDADSLVVGSPDFLFDVSAGADSKLVHRHHKGGGGDVPLTVVGGGDYFQTALMVAKPDKQLFLDVYLEFRLGTGNGPAGNALNTGYNQWRARDGILLRNCFIPHHKDIRHPTDAIYHFYGQIKPWFNKDASYRLGKADEKPAYNPRYHEWWRRYEGMHRRFFLPMVEMELARPENKGSYVYGNSGNFPKVPIPGVVAKVAKVANSKFDVAKVDRSMYPDVSPERYMWIQRFSVGTEYFRPTFAQYALIRNTPLTPAMRVLVGVDGQTCNDVCDAAGAKCSDAALQYTAVNDCLYHPLADGQPLLTYPVTAEVDMPHGHCKGCEYDFSNDGAAAPFINGKGGCRVNFLHNPAATPTCNASKPGVKRICPCATL